MADYGASDTSTTTLGTNQFPISDVHVPNIGLRALGGGPKQTDGGGKDYAPALVYTQDGSDVTQGTTTDVAVTGDNPGTQAAKLRGLSKMLANVWDSTNHWLQVKVMNATSLGQATMVNSAPVAIASDQTPLPVTSSAATSATATLANVGSSVTSVALQVSNANRKGWYCFNDSTSALYITFGATASATAFTVKVPAAGFFEMPTSPIYMGALNGAWDTANGNARVTELT